MPFRSFSGIALLALSFASAPAHVLAGNIQIDGLTVPEDYAKNLQRVKDAFTSAFADYKK